MNPLDHLYSLYQSSSKQVDCFELHQLVPEYRADQTVYVQYVEPKHIQVVQVEPLEFSSKYQYTVHSKSTIINY